ncbi:GDSL esterase/lipase At4g26790 [Diospyros lotus]|uniref:GDSL esterase/lipase At4g26790 n=1 Tax=Diospyros lotus TaxID=55363 RepID=UPI00224FB0B4|nr:GDSL esterase/lipase At4g26790 [Diospyros lotus]XP_052178645.1 GDSL esterase/lipase At4g26790 [Diospyros lotus]XP_052178646.1 GDSL esterase/lipase At4g26790 [Diospyros lotus]
MAIPLLLLLQFLQILSVQAKVSSLIVFGDSSVDSGNNNHISTMLKSDFVPYGRDFYGGKPTGRFSNGRIATDFISEAFGLKPTIPAYLDPTYNISEFASGVSFASAGTGYDNLTSDVMSVIPLWKELEYYKEYQMQLRSFLGDEKANQVLSEALYLISMGTNDFLANYYAVPGRSTQYSIEEYQNFLTGIASDFIIGLYKLGARKISLTGLPPMGCLPLERTRNFMYGSGCIELYNNVARDFNEKFRGLVDVLNRELAQIDLVFSNPYDILSEIILNPYSFGFENAAVGCCATGMFEMGYMCGRYNPFTCTDASKYVFWDSFHPTDKTNAIVAHHSVMNSLAKFL